METTTVYRNVTLDAHTGALIACATWGNELPGAYSYVLAEIADLDAAKETAAEFLRKYAPDYAANLRAERADSLSGDSTYNPGRAGAACARGERRTLPPGRRDGDDQHEDRVH